MAWHHSGDKPLSELMMVSLLTHICVTRPQWVQQNFLYRTYLNPSSAILYINISSVNTICLKAYWPGNLISFMSVNIWYQAAIFHLYKFMVWTAEWNDIWPRADSRFAPSQWETALLCNDISHWLGTNLESALLAIWWAYHICILSWWGIYSSSQDIWLALHIEHAYVMTWT